jgi:hypothetical protein
VRRCWFLLFLLLLGVSLSASAKSDGRGVESEHPEVERVRGFSEYLKEKNKRNSDQERGLQIHLEMLEVQAREYEKARREYAKQKKQEILPENSSAYRDHIIERQALRREDINASLEYKKERAREQRLLRSIGLNGMLELGLPELRPRYDREKRSLYGGKTNYSRPKETLPDRNFGRPSNNFTQPPPPPTDFPDNFGMEPPPFDDFPPPAFPEDGFDLPPPPPMDPFLGEPGTGADDFFPPPPPPPEFDDGMNF